MLWNEKLAPLIGIIKKPHVNSACIWCGACVAITDAQYFDLDMNGMATVTPCSQYEKWMIDDSISACPVNAISWQDADENGQYLWGVQEHQDV